MNRFDTPGLYANDSLSAVTIKDALPKERVRPQSEIVHSKVFLFTISAIAVKDEPRFDVQTHAYATASVNPNPLIVTRVSPEDGAWLGSNRVTSSWNVKIR